VRKFKRSNLGRLGVEPGGGLGRVTGTWYTAGAKRVDPFDYASLSKRGKRDEGGPLVAGSNGTGKREIRNSKKRRPKKFGSNFSATAKNNRMSRKKSSLVEETFWHAQKKTPNQQSKMPKNEVTGKVK